MTLGSGKHRSEIHAWQNKNIRHQSDWSKVSQSTQPFFPRTSWPRRVRTVWPQWLCQPRPQFWISPSSLIGPVSVQSTVLLIGTGSQTEQWISLSPFRKVLTRHITCHYHLIDQATVILCYELSGQEALNLHQVKTHVARAPCCF